VDLDVVFLGTSGSMPTAQRAPTATLIRRGGERLLFDCAEGTQRQLLRSSVGLVELREVFLTHYHADHYLGLPGMLKTFALRGRELPLTVHGPRGLEDLFRSLRRIFGKLTYDLELVELEPGATVEREEYVLSTFAVAHGVAAVGYALVEPPRPGRFDVDAAAALGVPSGPERGLLQRGESVTLPDGRVITPTDVLGPARPGRKVVIAGDGAPAASVLEASRHADPLVQEETRHSTARGAAELARAAEVRMLALTHLSNRYSGGEVLREARETFSDTVVPRDFDTIDVRFEERGGPQLVKGGAAHEHGRESMREREPVAILEEASE
jgi:ribonuclease Z